MIDWLKVFAPDTPPLEIIARGSAMYLAIFFILRVVMKRQSGTVGVSDLLVIVMIADAAQNGMASDYKSVADGVLLVATIVAWSYVLDYLAYKSPFIERLLQSQPLPLVQDGRMSKQNMRRELITVGELQALLRERGVEDISQVKRACMEASGELSVIKKEAPGGKNEVEQPKRQGV